MEIGAVLHLARATGETLDRTHIWPPVKKGTIKTTRVGGTAKAHEQNPSRYLANLADGVGYLIKGTSPNAGTALEIERIKP